MRKSFIAGMCLMSLALCADVSQPYSSVQNLPPTPYFVLDGYTYYSLINSSGASVIVDVESQDGSVARNIAGQASTSLPNVKQVYSVSAWQSSDHSQKHLFQRFLSNVNQENTTEMIVPIRMSSAEGAESLNVVADFISVVGGNDEKTIYNDILAWVPHLSDKGILCGNNWHEAGVQIGVARAAAALDLNLQVTGTSGIFKKYNQLVVSRLRYK